MPVVAPALLVELKRCEGHLHGDLSCGEIAGDVDVVHAERQHRVQSLALAVVERLDSERVSLPDRDDLLDLALKRIDRIRIGVDEACVGEEALVLVAKEVQELFCLLLGVAQFRRQDRIVVALLHGAHLLIDDLLVHPVELALHEREGVRLRDGLDVQVHRQRHRKIDDIREVVVLKHRTERADGEHASVRLVDPEDVRASAWLEVHERWCDQVARPRVRAGIHLVPGERERCLRAKLGVNRVQALGAV